MRMNIVNEFHSDLAQHFMNPSIKSLSLSGLLLCSFTTSISQLSDLAHNSQSADTDRSGMTNALDQAARCVLGSGPPSHNTRSISFGNLAHKFRRAGSSSNIWEAGSPQQSSQYSPRRSPKRAAGCQSATTNRVTPRTRCLELFRSAEAGKRVCEALSASAEGAEGSDSKAEGIAELVAFKVLEQPILLFGRVRQGQELGMARNNTS